MTSSFADYRRKLKQNDPEKFAEYLQTQKSKAKANRDRLKNELKKKKPAEWAIKRHQHQLDLAKIRQKKYDQKKRIEKKPDLETHLIVKLKLKKKKTVNTRKSLSTKREYNRLMKKKQRENMSYQKKMWIKKRDREMKMSKREQLKLESTVNTSTNTTSAFNTKKTEWNLTSKVRKTLPSTPSKCATIIKNIVTRTTPRKKKALLDIFKDVHEVNKSRSKNKRNKPNTMLKKCLFKRKHNIDTLKVKQFYHRQDISRIVPQKRYATKQGPGFFLQISIQAAHSKFIAENPNILISFSKFAALRPKNVRKLSASHREYCCCTYCINIRFKLLSLSRASPNKDKKKTNENDLFDILLCDKSNNSKFHEPACINGTCKQCFDYIKTLTEYYEETPENKIITWSKWEKEVNDGKTKRIVVTNKGTKSEIIKEMVEKDILKPAVGFTFFQHLFTANWQTMMFRQIKENLPSDSSLQVIDFAKNREIKYQDEIKSAFYTAHQITLHPSVTYLKQDEILKRVTTIIISEDNTHDHHAVHHFSKLVNDDIENDSFMKRKVIFSDGCSSQYKSRGPFADLAQTETPTNRNYFGSEHGKSECDGEIGILNRALDRAIIGKQAIINNATDLYNYCQKNLEINDPVSKRTFKLVKLGEINRKRNETDIKTITNTRKLHQAFNTVKADEIKVRNLSCFCKQCEAEEYEKCLNSKYVECLTTKKLVLLNKTGKLQKSENVPKIRNLSQNITVNPACPSEDIDEIPSQEYHNVETHRNYFQTNDNADRQLYFTAISELLQTAITFEDLQAKCIEVLSSSTFSNYNISVNKTIDIYTGNFTVDRFALKLLPRNKMPENLQNFLPVNVIGDGNCMARSASVACFGNEDGHEEVRCRIVIEMCCFPEVYMNNEHLSKHFLDNKEAQSLLQTYSMFSNEYTPGDRLTLAVIRRIFEAEALSVAKPKEFMGIFQIFALSSVLNSQVHSIYPDCGPDLPKALLHRCVHPRELELTAPQFCIMWTSTRQDLTAKNWIPNHFVPLLSMSEAVPDVIISDELDMAEEMQYSVISDTSLDFTFDMHDLDKSEESQVNSSKTSVEFKEWPQLAVDVPEENTEVREVKTEMPERKTEVTEVIEVTREPVEKTDVMECQTEVIDEEKEEVQEEKVEVQEEKVEVQEENVEMQEENVEVQEENVGVQKENVEVQEEKVEEKAAVKEVFTEILKAETPVIRFSKGSYVLLKHGTKMLPAVIIEEEEDFFWVEYYKQKRDKLWELVEKKFTVFETDIFKVLNPPDIVSAGGSRFAFLFEF